MRDDRPIRAEKRMTDVESTMWNIEKDPYLSSTFGSLTFFDTAPDFERFRKRMAYLVATVPRLRQRVVPALGRLAPPEWRDDPTFDLDYHVRRIGLPPGSSERDLLDLAPRLVQDPLDRTRPLWEMLVIEGLPSGRAAMLQKMHHTITDGEGGIRMSERMVDLTRDADDPDPPELPEAPPQETNILETALATAAHGLRRSAGVALRTADATLQGAKHPSAVVGAATGLPETVRSVARQLAIADRSRSPLWRERSLRRAFEILDVPFDEAKRASKNLGGSLNDFFVTGAAAAAGAYHRSKGTDVDELRMAMPISFREDASAGGNAFAPTRVLVPTSGSALDLFAEVRDRLSVTKAEKAIGVVGAMAGVVNLLPTSMLVRFARQQVETVDFTTSNLRAAPFELYISGARVLGNYPLGPLTGTAFNLTMMSYCGSLNMGLHMDLGAVDDPGLLRRCLEEAYAELVAAGS